MLGTGDGQILRNASGAWQHEPTGVTRPIVKLLGTAPHQIALMAGSPPSDSILQFNGLNWQAVEIRTDSTKSSVTTNGSTFPDGRVALVGGLCNRDGPCNTPVVVVSDWAGGRWRRAAVRFPVAVQLTGVWGASSADYYVYGGKDGGDCPPGLSCLLHILGDSAAPVEALRGATIIGMASIRSAPYALTSTGTLWTAREGTWGVVGEVPGSIIRGAASGPWVGLLGWNPQLMGLRIEVAAFWRSAARTVNGRQSRTEVRRVVVTHDFKAERENVWVLSVSGALSRIECTKLPGRFAGWRCGEEHAVAAPDRRRVLTVEVGSDDSVRVGGEHGLVAMWTGNGWRTQQLPAEVASEDVVSLSMRGKGPRLALTTGHLCREDSVTAWGKCDALPPWLAAEDVRGLPNGVIGLFSAVVLGARGIAMVGDSGRFVSENPLQPGGASPTSIETLNDGRIVIGYATPDDPLLGGHLFVGGVGTWTFDSALVFGHGGIALMCTLQWKEVPLPPAMDVYGIRATSDGVVVVGSGWHWIEYGGSELPFAKRPQCATPRPGRH